MDSLQGYYRAALKGLKAWVTSKRFSIYLICVLVAGTLWLLIKFGRDYNAQFPVELSIEENIGKDWFLLNPNQEVQAEIYGFGFDLFLKRIFGFDRILLEPEDLVLEPGVNRNYYLVYPAEVIKQLNLQLEGDAQVTHIYPSPIRFEVSRAIEKKVPVLNRYAGITKRGFILKSKPYIQPDTLTFFGPESILNTLESIETKADTLRNLTATYSQPVSLELDSLAPFLVGSPSFLMTIEVDELTTGTIQVPVAFPEEGPKLRVLPSEVVVHYQVGLSDFERINADLFSVSYSLPQGGELPAKLKVKLIECPDFVQVQRISPRFLEYLIINPKDP